MRNLLILACFLVGGMALYFVANPFLESMLGLSIVIGVPTFVFVQWVAPFLSEFPEKVSAFYWARSVGKAPMALMNMISSGIAELTLLLSLIPIVYCISRGGIYVINFDHHHQVELLLTGLQSLLGFTILANMRFHAYEAMGLFLLFAVQFVMPSIREEILVIYGGWILIEIMLAVLGMRKFNAFGDFRKIVRRHLAKPKPK